MEQQVDRELNHVSIEYSTLTKILMSSDLTSIMGHSFSDY